MNLFFKITSILFGVITFVAVLADAFGPLGGDSSSKYAPLIYPFISLPLLLIFLFLVHKIISFFHSTLSISLKTYIHSSIIPFTVSYALFLAIVFLIALFR